MPDGADLAPARPISFLCLDSRLVTGEAPALVFPFVAGGCSGWLKWNRLIVNAGRCSGELCVDGPVLFRPASPEQDHVTETDQISLFENFLFQFRDKRLFYKNRTPSARYILLPPLLVSAELFHLTEV